MVSRKVYLADPTAGSSTDYWEREWADSSPAQELERERDAPSPHVRLFRNLLPATGLVVEAGCGNGALGMAIGTERRIVVSIDLAQKALARSHSIWPDFRGVAADLRAVPLVDGSVDAIVSVGVIEHTEAGPGPLLDESFRILKPGGVLLVAVPALSPLKSVNDAFEGTLRRRPSWVRRGRIVTRAPIGVAPAGRPEWTFHQYELSRRDFDTHLRAAGFTVKRHIRYLVSAGVGELPAAVTRATVRQDPPTAAPPCAGGPQDARPSGSSERGPSRPAGRVRSTVSAAIREDESTATRRLLTAGARWAAGHMDLAVALRPAD